MAVRSEPPRPSVWIMPSGVTPWNPATTRDLPSARYFRINEGSMLRMRPRVCEPVVWMPAWRPVMETASTPRSCSAMVTSAIDCCSPVASSTSISRSLGLPERSLAILIRPSVMPDIAETTATTWLPSSRTRFMRAATLRMRSRVPTEVPPYFWTMRAMG